MIRDCQGDPDKLAVLLPCMQYWRDPADDFAWNTISKRAIVYSCGMIALDGVPTVHRHDPAELKLCHTLSAEAASIMKATEAGMGSEGSANLDPFFVTANVGAAVPERITDPVIRTAFGGTVHPRALILVEPMEQQGEWWSRVLLDCGGCEEDEKEDYLAPWLRLMTWFHGQGKLQAPSFVMIGDNFLDQESTKNGCGCVYPRLAVGITKAGSLVGLFTHVVYT